jgi:hypothetical protein
VEYHHGNIAASKGYTKRLVAPSHPYLLFMLYAPFLHFHNVFITFIFFTAYYTCVVAMVTAIPSVLAVIGHFLPMQNKQPTICFTLDVW